MAIEAKPLAEITQTAIRLLCKEIGLVNTVRFINQFSAGYGNYTAERDELFAGMTLDDMISSIKRNRASPGPVTGQ